ncbi:MAG: tetratricopeptide repeat protein [Verrucomicrobiota bacterium]|nr:tetratricopeptide repeat protein [Verrucomicrobiota bacterium]
MPTESEDNVRFQIGHVLFIDLVGYSQLLIEEQKERLSQLTEIVLATSQVREAPNEQLVRLPTGDGMALVFRNSSEEPARCALEIAEALRKHPEIPVRMGIHSGPVSEVSDVSGRTNIAGAGINIAQRVMDCGDAGHILLSQRVADDLAQYRQWAPRLHDLGECEVKHGVRLHLVNLYAEQLGNAAVPEKFKRGRNAARLAKAEPAKSKFVRLVISLVILVFIAIPALIFTPAILKSWRSKPAPTATPSPVPATAPAIPEKSIAVLPFQNLSKDEENAFFADGVQDEILANLAKVADLKVISRTSVMQYKTGAQRNLREIGQQLGVAHLLEGSVQRVDRKVRVNAQLIDARTDAHIWAQIYDRQLADVFAIQSEISKAIADQLHAQLSPDEKSLLEKKPTTDLAAYELYLRALSLYADASNQLRAAEKLPEAARLLTQAVTRDPKFLLAWCRLSRVHGLIYWQGHDHTPARLELADKAVQNALRIDPKAGEAHLALADYYYHGFRDYGRAKGELEIARETLPNNAEVYEYTGYILRRQGQWPEATRNLERALELDPRNFFILQQMALAYEAQHRYADQIAMYSRALTIQPGDPATRIYRAEAELEWRADIKPFQETLATLIAEDPSVAPDVDDPRYALCERTAAAMERALKNYPADGLVTNGVTYPLSYWEGVAARFVGNSDRAQKAFSAARVEVATILAHQPEFAPALSLLGLIDAGLGKKEEALREGRRACELLPVSQDAIDGVALAVNLAQIYAWTGERDLAITQIATVEQAPNYLSYGFLKLQPFWDLLRGDPRFEKIVASLAPNQSSP